MAQDKDVKAALAAVLAILDVAEDAAKNERLQKRRGHAVIVRAMDAMLDVLTVDEENLDGVIACIDEHDHDKCENPDCAVTTPLLRTFFVSVKEAKKNLKL